MTHYVYDEEFDGNNWVITTTKKTYISTGYAGVISDLRLHVSVKIPSHGSHTHRLNTHYFHIYAQIFKNL